MKPVNVIEGGVSFLDRADVDTDQIIPKQFLKRVERTGFGEFLFYDWIRDGEIELEPNPILVAGRNFGCGSSREHAPWALEDFGFEAIVAPVVRRHLLQQLHEDRPAAGRPRARRLPRAGRGGSGTDRPGGPDGDLGGRRGALRDRARGKHRLLNGLDDIGVTLQRAAAIDDLRGAGRADRAPGHDRRYERRRGRLGRGVVRRRSAEPRRGAERSWTGWSCRATRRCSTPAAGRGRSSMLLLERLPEGRLIGVDASAAMIEKAREAHRRRSPGRPAGRRPARPGAGRAGGRRVLERGFHWILDHERLFGQPPRRAAPRWAAGGAVRGRGQHRRDRSARSTRSRATSASRPICAPSCRPGTTRAWATRSPPAAGGIRRTGASGSSRGP